MTTSIHRRTLLATAGGLAATAAVGLSACNSGGGGAPGNDASVNTGVKLPTYKQYDGLKPDLAPTAEGVDAGFKLFPTNNPKSVPEKPGSGSDTITGMANIYLPVPPGPDANPWWKGLNERMGVNLNMQMVASADYPQKFATVMAGGDIPDIVMLQQPPTAIANLPQMLKSVFTDLTEYLSGDAVLEYPNLANIAQRHWKASVYNGGIYGIPIPRGAVGNYVFIRRDLFDAKGLDPEPKSYEDLKKTSIALTNAGARQWAFSLGGNMLNMMARITKAPNNWRWEGGKLTKDIETEEYKAAVAKATELWKAGVVHPDGFSTSQPFKALFNAGTCAMNPLDGYPGWVQYILDNTSNPNFKLGLMPIYEETGGQLAPWFTGSGYFSLASFKKTDNKDRIKLLLRTMNYLSAPFGTEEYLYRLYGQEGRDHTKDAQGNPALTKEGTANTAVPVRYMADAPYTLYMPGRPEDATTQYDYQKKVLAKQTTDPTIGLYSNLSATKGGPIMKTVTDGVNDIIAGRKQLSDLDGLVSGWKAAGGDEIRKEYMDQLNDPSAAPKS